MDDPQPPVTVAAPLKLAKILVQLAPAATTVFAGQLTVGGAQPGCMVRVKVQLAVSDAPSVAVRVMICIPTCNTVPETGLCVLAGLAVQLSEAVAAPVKLASE